MFLFSVFRKTEANRTSRCEQRSAGSTAPQIHMQVPLVAPDIWESQKQLDRRPELCHCRHEEPQDATPEERPPDTLPRWFGFAWTSWHLWVKPCLTITKVSWSVFVVRCRHLILCYIFECGWYDKCAYHKVIPNLAYDGQTKIPNLAYDTKQKSEIAWRIRSRRDALSTPMKLKKNVLIVMHPIFEWWFLKCVGL